MAISAYLAVSPLGAIAQPFALGGGVRVDASQSPPEHCAVWSGSALVLGLGHGNADGLADAYFDAALPAQWLTGFAAGYLSHAQVDADAFALAPPDASPELLRAIRSGSGARATIEAEPERALLAGAATLAERVRREAAAVQRDTHTGFDSVSFRLKGTFVEAIALAFEGERRVHYAVLGDVALFRQHENGLERIARGGTIGDDLEAAIATGQSEAIPEGDLDMLRGIVSSYVDGLDGAIVGSLRTGTISITSGDRLLVTSRSIHGAIDEPRIGTLVARGQAGVEQLRHEATTAGKATQWPSAVLLEIS